MLIRAALALLVLALPAGTAAQAQLSPCTIPEVDGSARCGTYRVFEDRASRRGRTIDLNVVVLTATGRARQPDPLFVMQGGPGQGVAQLADFYGRIFARVRQARDIVLVDLRGTGKSALLDCPLLGEPTEGHFDDQLLSKPAVRACRDALSARADLTKYTTKIALADLDEVRQALGYERINIYGTSYGSYAAQLYVRDYPARVRSVAMKGVVPLGQLAPLYHARDGQLAWERLVTRCNADATCRASYPDLDTDLQTIVTRLQQQPQQLAVTTREGAPATITLSADLLGELLRNMLYTPENQARVPALIRQVASGDLSALAPLAVRTRTALGGSDLSAGFFLSVTCAEGGRAITPEQVAVLTHKTFAGGYRLKQQRAACDAWPAADRAPVPSPFKSAVPVLMLSGEFDPVTPPTRAEELLAYFSNGRHVVAVNNGHPFGKLEGCGNVLIAQFIEQATAAALDSGCAKVVPAVPFAQ